MKFHQVAAATATDREGNIENDLRPSLHAFLRLFKQLKTRAGGGTGGGDVEEELRLHMKMAKT